MKKSIMRENTPLSQDDCFVVSSKNDPRFDFPLHCHDEYELNLIVNACGAKRIVGGHIQIIDDLELVLIGPNLSHTWSSNDYNGNTATETTILFHKDLFDDKFLSWAQLDLVKNMLERSQKGILFPQHIASVLKDRIIALNVKNGFQSVLDLLSILHDLAVVPDLETLSDTGFSNVHLNYDNRRLNKVSEYMNKNYNQQVTLAEVARIAGMSEASFSRFIKQRTGKTFIDSLNEIKLEYASRMLIETTNTIAEIAYNCGFNNISNFNRVFKCKKFCIPSEFRETYSGYKVSA